MIIIKIIDKQEKPSNLSIPTCVQAWAWQFVLQKSNRTRKLYMINCRSSYNLYFEAVHHKVPNSFV